MAEYTIKMPDIGEGIAEVELVEWHVREGDEVVEDQVLADVMTDKATVQVLSPVNGRVLALGGRVGEVLAVGSELVRLVVAGEGAPGGESAPVQAPTPAYTENVAPPAALEPVEQLNEHSPQEEIGRASCRESGEDAGVAGRAE